MDCKYRLEEKDFFSFVPQVRYICTYNTKPLFPECNMSSCTYIQEVMEEELQKNPPLHPGYHRCPYMPPNSSVECSIFLNDCSTCGQNPAVRELHEREKALLEQKRMEDERKLSYKLKNLVRVFVNPITLSFIALALILTFL